MLYGYGEFSSDGYSDQEENDSDGEEEPLSFTESSSDGDTKEEEEPLSAPLPPPRPHPLSTSQCADVHRESKLLCYRLNKACILGVFSATTLPQLALFFLHLLFSVVILISSHDC